MKVLEQILQEIEEKLFCITGDDYRDESVVLLDDVREIIRSHMGDDGWIPVEERLPENSKYKGAFCPKYRVLTKYGETVGWYNPNFESWYVLIWFMTDRFLETEIDFERGDVPKVVRAPMETKIVTAWRPRED